MKHILMATTALVSAAGIASADVSLSGWAEMGMVGGNGGETEFHQDIDVSFSMSGETDGGLSFSAGVDLDEWPGAGTPNDDGGVAINISGGFGSLTMGDTDGALDWALTEGGNVKNGGSIADNETGHAGYRGSYLDGNEDGQILRYDNTIGSMGIAASIEMDDNGNTALSSAAAAASAAGTLTVRNTFVPNAAGTVATAAATATVATIGNVAALTESGDSSMALGVKYNMDLAGGNLAMGLGYQTAADRVSYVSAATDSNANAILTSTVSVADTSAVGFSATYAASSGFSIGVALTEYDDFVGVNARASVAGEAGHGAAGAAIAGYLSDASHLSIGVGFTTGPVTLHANYGELDYDAVAIADVDGYGVSIAYDLGGGAKVKLGMNDNAAGDDFSFGLAMSF
jgi:outer membrane protein OmpU